MEGFWGVFFCFLFFFLYMFVCQRERERETIFEEFFILVWNVCFFLRKKKAVKVDFGGEFIFIFMAVCFYKYVQIPVSKKGFICLCA